MSAITNEFSISTAAGTAIVGYNLIKDEKWKAATYARKITSISLVGSAAIGDCAIELWVGEARKGVFWNTHAGASVVPLKEDSRFPTCLVPANSEVQAKVIDAPVTNPIILTVQFNPSKKRRFIRGFAQNRVIRNPAAYAAAVARNKTAYGR